MKAIRTVAILLVGVAAGLPCPAQQRKEVRLGATELAPPALRADQPAPGKWWLRRDGVLQPGPAPRFSRTRPEIGSEPQGRGAGSEAVLKDWGFAAAEIATLGKSGVIGIAKAQA